LHATPKVSVPMVYQYKKFKAVISAKITEISP
jgi:hypothetical protein